MSSETSRYIGGDRRFEGGHPGMVFLGGRFFSEGPLSRFATIEDDVPFEFVGEVARSRAVAKASHVERGASAARHGDDLLALCEREGRKKKEKYEVR
jgi:hypothetical protein